MKILSIIFLFWNIIHVYTIQIKMIKRNIFIPQDSSFLSTLELQRQNAELIPTSLSLQTQITNTIPRFGDYFDYFYFMTQTDLQCYKNAVQNQSYLFPCSFLSNHYAINRVSEADSQKLTQQIDVISDVVFSFIIDNTLYPYPQGAYSYSNINIDVTTTLDIKVSPSYEILGTRLIYINATIFLIFLVIIIVMICKTNAISKKMSISKNDSSANQNHAPYLEQLDEDNESSFISQQQQKKETQNQAPEGFFQDEQGLTQKLRGSQENNQNAKVKSGLIQYLESRVDDQ